jgi:hypothetical protein
MSLSSKNSFPFPSVVDPGICRVKDSCPSSITTETTSLSGVCFLNVIVQVDCEALLKNMMEEAGEVVGTVVDLTNEAWVERKKLMARMKDEATLFSSSMNQDSSLLSSFVVKRSSSPAALMESTKCAPSQTLGVVKTVSESELSCPVPTASATTNSQEGGGQDSTLVDDWFWQHRFIEGDSLDASLLSRDSDEEDTNPGMLAEKASHIIDYVFDEIEDGLIPPPLSPRRKKARLESL